MKTKPELTFDESSHRYFLGGLPVPGVTSVLSAAFGDPWKNVPEQQREYALGLGRAVHRWCELVDTGSTSRPTGEHMQGYLAAWENFKRENGLVILAVEKRVVSYRYRYAGTLDRVCIFEGKKAVLDIKTGQAIHPFAAIQTAAYAAADNEMGGQREKVQIRLTVLLKQDGSYIFIPHKDKTDINVFLACLSVMGWKRTQKLTMEPEVE